MKTTHFQPLTLPEDFSLRLSLEVAKNPYGPLPIVSRANVIANMDRDMGLTTHRDFYLTGILPLTDYGVGGVHKRFPTVFQGVTALEASRALMEWIDKTVFTYGELLWLVLLSPYYHYCLSDNLLALVQTEAGVLIPMEHPTEYLPDPEALELELYIGLFMRMSLATVDWKDS